MTLDGPRHHNGSSDDRDQLYADPMDLLCELCAKSDWQEYWLTVPDHVAPIRTGLLVCRWCRTVHFPGTDSRRITVPNSTK